MWQDRVRQNSRLGGILMRKKFITPQQLHAAVAAQRAEPTKTLGEILIESGAITPRQLRRSLRKQSRIRHVAALVALLLAPFHLASAGGLPSGSSNVERAVAQSALRYEQRPQLDLDTDDDRRVYTGERAAKRVAGMSLKMWWSSMQRSVDDDDRSSHSKMRYDLRISADKVIVRLKRLF